MTGRDGIYPPVKNDGGAQATCPPSILFISAFNFPFQLHDVWWFFWSPSHFIRASTKALIACLAKSGVGPPKWMKNFLRPHPLRPQSLHKYPRRSLAFWGPQLFHTTRSSRTSLWSTPMLTGGHCLWLRLHRLEDCFFPPAVQSIEGCEG